MVKQGLLNFAQLFCKTRLKITSRNFVLFLTLEESKKNPKGLTSGRFCFFFFKKPQNHPFPLALLQNKVGCVCFFSRMHLKAAPPPGGGGGVGGPTPNVDPPAGGGLFGVGGSGGKFLGYLFLRRRRKF